MCHQGNHTGLNWGVLLQCPVPSGLTGLPVKVSSDAQCFTLSATAQFMTALSNQVKIESDESNSSVNES